ncbi:hypothetical protein DPMN_150272 [Dreissena polymorpha]|uniref:Uncharacterized protein n=1 Tax=Dreissena polymorpha TaxID=45954 RepID=A0A9D4FD56_DREPO|nr:hypothetical protein DPMN_150272 [Dreissena polymorpha]
MASAGEGLRHVCILMQFQLCSLTRTTSRNTSQKPDELEPPKRKRDKYGAFTKRNRKTVGTK